MYFIANMVLFWFFVCVRREKGVSPRLIALSCLYTAVNLDETTITIKFNVSFYSYCVHISRSIWVQVARSLIKLVVFKQTKRNKGAVLLHLRVTTPVLLNIGSVSAADTKNYFLM